VDVPGYTKHQIHDESKAWIIEKFKKSAVIERDNRETGVLIATGAMRYPGSWKEWLTWETKTGVDFRMKVESEDDMFHLTFDDLRITALDAGVVHVGEYGSVVQPGGKREYEVCRQDHVDAIRPELLKFGDEIAEAIRRLEKLPPRETVETMKAPADVPISEKNDRYTELIKLKQLLDAGIITQEEYEIEKKEILEKY
jgi:hypothetical protein